MHDDIASALRFLAVAGAAALVIALGWLAVRAHRESRRRSRGKGMPAMGALVMLFGWGQMRDPRNDTVAEANEGQVRRGNHAGDPPDPT